MPSAKGTKRQAKADVAVAPKKQKPKANPMLVAVIEAISQADSLPEECRAMLTAVAPGCLETPADERHKSQATMVSWIADVLDGVKAKLQAAVDEVQADAAVADETKRGLSGCVEEAKAALAAAKEGVAAKGTVLTEAVEAMNSVTIKVPEAQAVKAKAVAKVEELGKEKLTLEKVLAEDLKYLKSEEGFETLEAEMHAGALVPLAEKLSLEASLVLALRPACAKPPSERGDFGAMVLDQVEAGIGRRAVALAAELEEAGASVAEHESSLEAARSSVLEAEHGQRAAAAALEAAEAQQRGAAEALRNAEAALKIFVKEQSPADEVRNAKVAALENFTNYNLECFAVLRDRVAKAGA